VFTQHDLGLERAVRYVTCGKESTTTSIRQTYSTISPAMHQTNAQLKMSLTLSLNDKINYIRSQK